ncbi:hypothetical protein M5C72_01755 [Companilactobacillus allii]|uniref:hypothetical protein n=1 Tax=Companilactobacillus allii TaxID=1847728 RepID=UPI0012FF5DB2|nr:hypothetical protein [Companilactobacillus allii]USQ68984.1 hypothetical protein M5C72_01755 [Companilactobacillus allii]
MKKAKKGIQEIKLIEKQKRKEYDLARFSKLSKKKSQARYQTIQKQRIKLIEK